MARIEKWRKIHSGFYEVSNLGNVRRAKPGIATFIGRPVMPIASATGYFQVQLGGVINRRAYVHNLVAEAFLGVRPEGRVINHIDAVKTNNAADNLEYVTRSQNAHHSVKTTTRRKGPVKEKPSKKGMPTGENHWSKLKPHRIARGSKMPHCKLNADLVRSIRSRVANGETQSSVAREIGISIGQMSRIIQRTRWTYV